MIYIKFILLGIIQGITEPLPISSSGHIFLFKNIFGTELFNTFNFEIFSNIGSFIAILFIYRKDIIKLIIGFIKYMFKKNNEYINVFKYVIKLIISTIPVGVIGILFNDYLETNYTSLKLLAFSFLFTSLVLFLTKNSKEEKNSNDITIKDAIIIGLMQMITVIPGISRSGTVLVTSLFCKIKKDDALKYTFMLYFPVSIGTIIIKVPDIINTPNNILLPYLSLILSSLVITLLSYKWLINILKKGKLYKFSFYCLFLALFIFIYFR